MEELDKSLLRKIKSVLSESDVIQAARSKWQGQVRDFESDHNSVVIAAGNSGGAVKGLKHAGFDIDGSEDINIFATPEVTVVGALTQLPKGGLGLASRSSFGNEVGFLASGDYGKDGGTSFASPRVANAMRASHLANPKLTSEEAENWARAELSTSAEVLGHTVAILDDGRTQSLIRLLDRL